MSSLLHLDPRRVCRKHVCKNYKLKNITPKLYVGHNPKDIWKVFDKAMNAPSEIKISKEASANYVRKINRDKRCPHYHESLNLAKWM